MKSNQWMLIANTVGSDPSSEARTVGRNLKMQDKSKPPSKRSAPIHRNIGHNYYRRGKS